MLKLSDKVTDPAVVPELTLVYDVPPVDRKSFSDVTPRSSIRLCSSSRELAKFVMCAISCVWLPRATVLDDVPTGKRSNGIDGSRSDDKVPEVILLADKFGIRAESNVPEVILLADKFGIRAESSVPEFISLAE